MTRPTEVTPKVTQIPGAYIQRVVLAQQSDCVQRVDSPDQRLEVVIEHNGTAHFAVLKTTRWSISGPEDLRVLGEFIKRLQDDADAALGCLVPPPDKG